MNTEDIISWLEEKARTLESRAAQFRNAVKLLQDEFCEFARELPEVKATVQYHPLVSPDPQPVKVLPPAEPEPKPVKKMAVDSHAPPMTLEAIHEKIGNRSSRIVYLAAYFKRNEKAVRELVESPESGLTILPRGWIKRKPPEGVPDWNSVEQGPTLLPDDCRHNQGVSCDGPISRCKLCHTQMINHSLYGWMVKPTESV